MSFANLDRTFNFEDRSLTDFVTPGYLQPPGWIWTTPDGHASAFTGNNLYTVNQRPGGGTISAFSLKLFDPNPSQPDLVITGLSFDFYGLYEVWEDETSPSTRSNSALWLAVLSGDDTIDFGTKATAGGFSIFFAGDGESLGWGSQKVLFGGDDTMIGDIGEGNVSGDTRSTGADTTLYGGNDRIVITAKATSSNEINGDAHVAFGGSTVFGGNDYIRIVSGGVSQISGDVNDTYIDTIVVGGDDDIAGAPTLFGDAEYVSSHFRGGNDILTGSNAPTTETLIGDAKFVNSTATARGGDDTIRGNDGPDVIVGDFWQVNSGSQARGGNDLLYGGAGADELYGDWQEDEAGKAVGGNDVLDGGSGADLMAGGSGNDIFYVDQAGDIVIEAVAGGSDRVVASTSYVLAPAAEIEALITANAAAATVINFTGNAFAQTIQGNAGANIINGGGGADTMQGFAGADRYYVDNAGDKIIEAAGGGSDRVLTAVNFVLTAGAEVELFTTTNATATNAINLIGNAFAQTIEGNNGANIMSGGLGSDMLRGLGGRDTFTFDTALGAGNIDTIADFAVADDTVRLAKSVFTQLAGSGVMTAAQFVANAAGAATDQFDRVIYDTDDGRLLYDADGLGGVAAIQFAKIAANLAITNADFLVA